MPTVVFQEKIKMLLCCAKFLHTAWLCLFVLPWFFAESFGWSEIVL